MTATDSAGSRAACRNCRHFTNDPRSLEAAIPGWNVLGSAYGSTRAEDGICGLHGILACASQWCQSFEGREASGEG